MTSNCIHLHMYATWKDPHLCGKKNWVKSLPRPVKSHYHSDSTGTDGSLYWHPVRLVRDSFPLRLVRDSCKACKGYNPYRIVIVTARIYSCILIWLFWYSCIRLEVFSPTPEGKVILSARSIGSPWCAPTCFSFCKFREEQTITKSNQGRCMLQNNPF